MVESYQTVSYEYDDDREIYYLIYDHEEKDHESKVKCAFHKKVLVFL